MEDYSQYKIKDYKYWTVQVHSNQGYLGRCIVWCKREDALDLADATPEEREELFLILKELREALSKSFAPDWFNYTFLGNGTRHLHGHIVPRYATNKEFAGVTFEDKLWGHNYKTNHDFHTSPELLEAVKDTIRENLVVPSY